LIANEKSGQFTSKVVLAETVHKEMPKARRLEGDTATTASTD